MLKSFPGKDIDDGMVTLMNLCVNGKINRLLCHFINLQFSNLELKSNGRKPR